MKEKVREVHKSKVSLHRSSILARFNMRDDDTVLKLERNRLVNKQR